MLIAQRLSRTKKRSMSVSRIVMSEEPSPWYLQQGHMEWLSTNDQGHLEWISTMDGGASSSSMDVAKSEFDAEKHEQQCLVVSKNERLSTTSEYKQELNNIANKRNDAESGVALSKRVQMIRKRVVSTIISSAQQVYATWDDEYAAIGKFHRGMFRQVAFNDSHPRKDRLFDDAEKEILTEIARAYGVFGY